MAAPHDYRPDLSRVQPRYFPSPPRLVKPQFYSNPDYFKDIDNHAMQVAQTNHATFKDFLWHLIGPQRYTELQIARVIFRWLTCRNMSTITFSTDTPGALESILSGFKLKRSTYARIFEAIAGCAGLNCVTVTGFAKGMDYTLGNVFRDSTSNHSWNAVCVNGDWQLVDSHWATRYLNASEKNVAEKLIYEHDDFYFMPEPAHMVYTHFPEDPVWQLLATPISLDHFESLPLAKSIFFKLNMGFLTHHFGIVRTEKGLCKLSLSADKNVTFTYKLLYGSDLDSEVDGVSLSRYVLQTTAPDSTVTYFFRAPKAGSYAFTVYVQQTGKGLQVENVFTAAVEYRILVDTPVAHLEPYPQVSDANWGPGLLASQCGIISNQPAGILLANRHNEVSLSLESGKPLRCYCKLNKNGSRDDLLGKYIEQQVVGNKADFLISLPEPGEYGFQIYMNDPTSNSNTFTHCCQYMLVRLPSGVEVRALEQYGLPPSVFDFPTHDSGEQPPQLLGGMDQFTASMGAMSLQRQPQSGHFNAPDIYGAANLSGFSKQPQESSHNSFPNARHSNEQGQGPYGENRGVYGYVGNATTKYPDGTSQSPYSTVGHVNVGSVDRNNPNLSKYSTMELPRSSPVGSTSHAGYSQFDNPREPKEMLEPRPRGSIESPSPLQDQIPLNLGSARKEAMNYPSGVVSKSRPTRGSVSSPVARDAYSPRRDSKEEPNVYATAQLVQKPPPVARRGDAPRPVRVPRKDSLEDEAFPPPPPDLYNEPESQVVVAPLAQMSSTAPPPSFIPKMQSPQEEFLPIPKPLPRGQTELYDLNDPAVFRGVDKHAQEISAANFPSFRELIWNLIHARQVSGNLEKARILFRWLCSKDLTQVEFSNVQPRTPEELLLALKDGKVTYAQIYEMLCKYAGLHCVTLSGYAKGAEYRPGHQFGDQGQHAWNAVLINGQWRLVDCHWAARRMMGNKGNVKYELDEYFFLPNPHQFIFSHFPAQQEYQLLERPLTVVEFQSLPVVKSQFFKYGLYFASHNNAIIQCDDEVGVSIGYPPSKKIGFSFTLSTDDGRSEIGGTKLNRYGMYEQGDGVAKFHIRPPERGAYRLIIYAKQDASSTNEGVYGAVCEYKIEHNRSDGRGPFPPCQSSCWGPGGSVSNMDIEPLQQSATVFAPQGLAEIGFKTKADIRFLAKLKSDFYTEEQLDCHVLHRVVNGVALFTVSLPAQGYYGLEVYLNCPATDGNSFRHLCQYLIICPDASVIGLQFPSLQTGYLGPQATFSQFGLSEPSNMDPFVVTTTNELQLSLSFSFPLRVTSQLLKIDTKENFDQNVLVQTHGSTLSFNLRLPVPAMYQLSVFALPSRDRTENLPGIYNYLIHCTGAIKKRVVVFPQQYGQWKEGCFLHSPVDGDLSISHYGERSIPFSLNVPNAQQVAVVVGDEWVKLVQVRSDTWEGDVTLSDAWGREHSLAVCANFGGDVSSFSTLLEYSL